MIKKIAILSILMVSFFQLSADEKAIVIIVPSRNNNELFEGKERYKLNLGSIFDQDYENYRIIYVDDYSTDGTADLVENYIQEKGQAHRVTLIKNKKRWGPSRNRYVTTHLCDDNEIVMYLDGDDWFPHSSVLKIINDAYDDPNIWFTYSHFRHAPDDGNLSGGIEMPDWVISQNSYRKYGWYFHSLKTFYAWLFKYVKLEDLLYEGSFLPIASDMAETFPIAEMSSGHFKFIEDVLYIASVHQTNEMKIAGWDRFQVIYQHIVTMPAYTPLNCKPGPQQERFRETGIDVLWFCQSDPADLQDSMQDFKTYVSGIHNLYIIVDDTALKDSVSKAVACFANEKIIIKSIQELCDQDFLLSLSDYLLLMSDKQVPCTPIDLIKAAESMNTTYAYAFYFSKNARNLEQWHNIPCFNMAADLEGTKTFYAFQLVTAKKAFDNINTMDCAMYSKSAIANLLVKRQYNTGNNLAQAFAMIGFEDYKIALVYEQASTLSINRI